jgi:hypothetical protein
MGTAHRSAVEALTRAHVALQKELGKLEEAARPASVEGAAALRARLMATHTHVIAHFRFEEDNGYLDAVSRREPRLGRVVRELAEDHRRLAESLEALVEEAWAAPHADDTLRGKVRAWLGQLGRHEARENDLVQEAFNADIGAED